MTPLAIDLYCGLGGWTEGMLAEGYDCIGFDVERHDYGSGGYPAQLVLQDVLTLHGSQFKDAALIVASPPCQAYSYRAMPWSRAKALPPPDNSLFEACFRIQREACAAAGRHIPLVVENVRGAQKWVGRARAWYGSYYLWGDVPALMPIARSVQKFNPDGTAHSPGSWFAVADSKNRGSKNNGGSWFGVGSPGQKELGRNPVNQPAACFSSPETSLQAGDGIKHHASGAAWFDGAPDKMLGHAGPAKYWSGSNARKAASAMIARIPFTLARHIAASWKPRD